MENGVTIRKCLSTLFLDRDSGKFARARIDADDARDDHERSGLDALAVERGTRCICGGDDLSRHDDLSRLELDAHAGAERTWVEAELTWNLLVSSLQSEVDAARQREKTIPCKVALADARRADGRCVRKRESRIDVVHRKAETRVQRGR